MKTLLATAVMLTALPLQALETPQGQPHELDSQLTHLAFINIWDLYGGKEDQLSLNGVPSLYVQPQINVTRAQLQQFALDFPAYQPLVMDPALATMRQIGVRQTGTHVLLYDGQVKFSGPKDKLQNYAQQYDLTQPEALPSYRYRVQPMALAQAKQNTYAPKPVSQGLVLEGTWLAGEAPQSDALEVIFLDALCPMPHFPNCEATLAKLAKPVDRVRVGVINNYYVDQATAQQFVDQWQLPFAVLFDDQQKVFSHYQVFETPYTITLEQGQIQQRGPLR